ncbi:hypothetical protein C0991_012485, partial [Blastosporella zonata]
MHKRFKARGIEVPNDVIDAIFLSTTAFGYLQYIERKLPGMNFKPENVGLFGDDVGVFFNMDKLATFTDCRSMMTKFQTSANILLKKELEG